MYTLTLGHSVEGRPVQVRMNFPPEGRRASNSGGTLLIGGTHGDESATVPLLEEFSDLYLHRNLPGPTAVISLFNPDGYTRSLRHNARGVDLNRNFEYNWQAHALEPSGDSPLSEPETQALRRFLDSFRPDKIVSLHWALGEIDPDGQHSHTLAQALWNSLTETERKPYRLKGFPDSVPAITECPGSLGQLCGFGLRYPDGRRPAMVTLELPHDPWSPRGESLPENHFVAVGELWRNEPARYMEAVREPVYKMLLAACSHNPSAVEAASL